MKKIGLKETKISKIHKDPEKFSIYIISSPSCLLCYDFHVRNSIV